jgi:hypothetical protein
MITALFLGALLAAAWAAPEDRFKGGVGDGSAMAGVDDRPVAEIVGTIILIH